MEFKNIILIVLLMVALIIGVLTIVIIVYKRKNLQPSNRSSNLDLGVESFPLSKWGRHSYNQLSDATNGFNKHNLLGFGRLWSVYKGLLLDGKVVAIKVFNLQSHGSLRSFDTQCEVMRDFHHPNVVNVISSCCDTNFKALVFEFIPNGSLDSWLYLKNCFLDVTQRINIMIDVASALQYFHLEHPGHVIHCDLEPRKVLIDENMVAHVGGFGISNLLGKEDSKQTRELPTFGYMAPEYGTAGLVSVKTDIYSYGIMLVEIFTKKRPIDKIFTEEMDMKHWVSRALANNDIISIIDCQLVHRGDNHFLVKAGCFVSIMELAMKCTTESPKIRIDILSIASELQNIKKVFLNCMEDKND